jgi:hypothetical protein
MVTTLPLKLTVRLVLTKSISIRRAPINIVFSIRHNLRQVPMANYVY